MNIQTEQGIEEVSAIHFFECNGRRWAIHRAYYDNDIFNGSPDLVASDYLTGLAVPNIASPYQESVEREARKEILKNKDFDYSPFTIINQENDRGVDRSNSIK